MLTDLYVLSLVNMARSL